MKKLILSIFVIFAASVFSSVFAQVMPAGASDSDLRDNNIRMRSNDLERVKRDADKTTTGQSPMNSELDAKYPEIKEDFEGIQISQSAIVKAYSTGQSIDYKLIETSAGDINKKAKRLSSNLFASKLDKKDKSKKNDKEQSKTLKEMIVELDNAIGDFATSAMFQNLKAVDSEVARKAQLDLANVAELSEKISKEAKKMK